VESVTTLFSLADKCARAAEGRAWHSAPQDGVAETGGSRATVQGPRLEPQLLRQQHQLQQRQLGARMRTASARARRVAMVVHAQFIPLLATAPLTAVRSRNSRSGSVGGVTRPSRTAHPLLASGLARRKPPTVRPLPWRRGWGTNPLLEN